MNPNIHPEFIKPPRTLPYTRSLFKDHIEKGGFEVGEWTYGTPELVWWGEKVRLKIGRFCCIADEVILMLGGNHRTDWITTYPFDHVDAWPEAHDCYVHPVSKGDIVIGHDAWIGYGATILSGVTIGHGAVIGAYAVVSKDIPDYAIAVGNPARVVRFRFPEEHIKKLLEIRWWEWDDARIHKGLHYINSTDIDALYQYWLEHKDGC